MTVLNTGGKLKNISSYVQVLLCAAILAFVLKAFVVDAVVIPSPSMERTLLVGDFVLVNKLVHGPPVREGKHAASSEAGFAFLPSVRQIDRGDVVVFKLPSDLQTVPESKEWFVKRCVGRPGDEIAIRSGNLYVNGELLPLFSADAPGDEENFGPLVVPGAGQEIVLTQRNYRQWEKLIRREGHSLEFTPARGIVIDGLPATRYTVGKNYLFVMGDNRDRSFDSRSWGFLPEENVIGTATCIYWSMDRRNHHGGIFDFFSAIRWNRVGTLIR
jgi:signal peptidase I